LSDKLRRFRDHDYPVPDTCLAWEAYGAGFENVGSGGRPVRVPVPKPGPRQILCRVDAVGLCFSDVKMILAGPNHPRILGRDLAKDPTRGGHELSLTVAAVGTGEEGDYKVGDRFILQADVYHEGRGMAVGYVIPGGMAEYWLCPEEVLRGDEGSYLIPITKDGMNLAEAALVEPWSCIEASYRIRARTAPRAGGRVLVVDAAGGTDRPEGLPGDAEVVLIEEGDPAATGDRIRAAFEETRSGSQGGDKDIFGDISSLPGFDDAIVTGAGTGSREVIEAALDALRRGGHLCLLWAGGEPGELPHEVTVDVGRVHYQDLRIVAGGTVDEAYNANVREDLKPGGTCFMTGAGGPMGQMHVQRAVEHEAPPAVVVVSDLSRERLDYTRERLGPVARERGVELVFLNPKDFASPDEFERELMSHAGPGGFDDVNISAPAAFLVGAAARQAGPGCVVNIFAGVPVGTRTELDLDLVARKHVRMVGSSGSRVSDMKAVVAKVESGALNTSRSLAAVGGLAQLLEGLKALKGNRFPGKTVIYPGVPDLPLTLVSETPSTMPAVGGKLGEGGIWTKAAEEAFLEGELVIPG
jgi:threonine dehydrogenase-like Zn-dependent dehydrogenase